jgi:GAF domain
MEPKRDVERTYVRKLQEDTRHYAERQASVVAKLERLVSSLEADRVRLQDEVAALRALLDSRDAEGSRLHVEMAAIVHENKRLSRDYVEVERQSSNLASLYVASLQLHASLEQPRVLSTIQEIVAALIGCEEVAVYALDRRGERLTQIAAFGPTSAFPATVPVGSGVIGRTASSGERYVRRGAPDPAAAPEESELTACLPLKVDGMVTGAIALFRLLSHKPDFEEADFELFDLLSTEAATALYCAELRANPALVAQ